MIHIGKSYKSLVLPDFLSWNQRYSTGLHHLPAWISIQMLQVSPTDLTTCEVRYFGHPDIGISKLERFCLQMWLDYLFSKAAVQTLCLWFGDLCVLAKYSLETKFSIAVLPPTNTHCLWKEWTAGGTQTTTQSFNSRLPHNGFENNFFAIKE